MRDFPFAHDLIPSHVLYLHVHNLTRVNINIYTLVGVQNDNRTNCIHFSDKFESDETVTGRVPQLCT